MHRFISNLSWLMLLGVLLVLASGCPGDKGGAKRGQPRGLPADVTQPTTAAGIDFQKTNVGLPSRTLDYIGDRATGLAGARAGRKLFFGASDEGTTNIFCRDLESFERTFVARVDGMQPATLACSRDGAKLAYCRARKLSNYIDDPAVTFPERVALPCLLDVASGAEQELFDFRQPDWRPYRSDTFSPFISPDGRQVVTLGYNIEALIVKQQLGDWLAMEADWRDRKGSMPEKERTETLTKLHQLLGGQAIGAQLNELGVTPTGAGDISEAERDAMKTLYKKYVHPQGALLIWRDGEAQLLPLSFAEGYADSYHFIISAHEGIVLLGVQDLATEPGSPSKVFRVDLASGKVSELFEFVGSPSTMELDASATQMLMVYNPVDTQALKVLTETRLKRFPLDGGAPTEVKLPGDFLGFVDINGDGSMMVAQDRDDNDLYLIETASGAKKKLLRLQAEISGVFLPEGGDRVAYLDSGIVYGVTVPPDPEASADWVKPEHFSAYIVPLTQFFADLGFVIPPDVQYEWEEKQGLGLHEISAQIDNPAKPGSPVLLRWDVTKQKMVSVWFVNGYTFDVPAAVQAGPKLDFFACKEIAETALDRVDWLKSDTRQEYHPGPNPLYDGRSDSYIVTFRDGYWIDDATWAINKEATVRVRAGDGQIAEMTLSERAAVMNQPLAITLEKAVFMIRNEGDQPIPEDAPVRFDTQNYRLVVAQKRSEGWGPVKFQGALVDRLAYEIDAFLTPEELLMMTSLVDTETGEMLGSLDYQPTNMAPVVE